MTKENNMECILLHDDFKTQSCMRHNRWKSSFFGKIARPYDCSTILVVLLLVALCS